METVIGKITVERKLLFAERKLGLPRTVKINSIIYMKDYDRTAPKNRKHNFHQLVKSHYKLLNFQEFIAKLNSMQYYGELKNQHEATRLIRKLKKKGHDVYAMQWHIFGSPKKQFNPATGKVRRYN